MQMASILSLYSRELASCSIQEYDLYGVALIRAILNSPTNKNPHGTSSFIFTTWKVIYLSVSSLQDGWGDVEPLASVVVDWSGNLETMMDSRFVLTHFSTDSWTIVTNANLYNLRIVRSILRRDC